MLADEEPSDLKKFLFKINPIPLFEQLINLIEEDLKDKISFLERIFTKLTSNSTSQAIDEAEYEAEDEAPEE